MKILILTNKVPYPADDGSSIAIASITDGLLKNGAAVQMLSLNTDKHFKPESEIQKSLPNNLVFKAIAAKTTPSKLGAVRNFVHPLPYHVSRFLVDDFGVELAEILRRENFDWVQMEGLAMAVYLDTILKNSAAKIALRAHNVEHQIWRRHLKGEKNAGKRFYLKAQLKQLARFEKDVAQKVDALVTISKEDFYYFDTEYLTEKSIVIPCGIDLENFSVCGERAAETHDIGYLAAFDWPPNVRGALWFLEKVWPIILEKRPQTTLKIGGRKMPPKLKHFQANNLTIQEDVPLMREFVCASKIIAVPLLAGSGMRIKILENSALGKCQVSTTIGAEGALFKNGEEILLADEPEDFAEKCVQVLDDEKLRQKIGEKARQKVEAEYGNGLLGKRLMHFYQKNSE